jgi:hypothetical protein
MRVSCAPCVFPRTILLVSASLGLAARSLAPCTGERRLTTKHTCSNIFFCAWECIWLFAGRLSLSGDSADLPAVAPAADATRPHAAAAWRCRPIFPPRFLGPRTLPHPRGTSRTAHALRGMRKPVLQSGTAANAARLHAAAVWLLWLVVPPWVLCPHPFPHPRGTSRTATHCVVCASRPCSRSSGRRRTPPCGCCMAVVASRAAVGTVPAPLPSSSRYVAYRHALRGKCGLRSGLSTG